MKPWDVVVQHGTNHAWLNRSNELVVPAGILISVEKIT